MIKQPSPLPHPPHLLHPLCWTISDLVGKLIWAVLAPTLKAEGWLWLAKSSSFTYLAVPFTTPQPITHTDTHTPPPPPPPPLPAQIDLSLPSLFTVSLRSQTVAWPLKECVHPWVKFGRQTHIQLSFQHGTLYHQYLRTAELCIGTEWDVETTPSS